MNAEILKEFVNMQNKLNDISKRIDDHSVDMHKEVTSDVDLHESMLIDLAYQQTLDEMGVDE
jgi:hypothetical protein